MATKISAYVKTVRGVKGSSTKRGGMQGYIREYSEEGEYIQQVTCKDLRATEAEAKMDAEKLAAEFTKMGGIKVVSTRLGGVVIPPAPEKIPAPKKIAPVASAAPKSTGKCKLCGKILERDSSISAGMGDVCQGHIAALPTGVTIEEHYKNIKVKEVPEGWIKLKLAIIKAKSKGISGSRFIKACGGNRIIRPAANKFFKVLFVGNTRYISEESLNHLGEIPGGKEDKNEQK